MREINGKPPDLNDPAKSFTVRHHRVPLLLQLSRFEPGGRGYGRRVESNCLVPKLVEICGNVCCKQSLPEFLDFQLGKTILVVNKKFGLFRANLLGNCLANPRLGSEFWMGFPMQCSFKNYGSLSFRVLGSVFFWFWNTSLELGQS